MDPVNRFLSNSNLWRFVNSPISLGIVIPLIIPSKNVIPWHSDILEVDKKLHAMVNCSSIGAGPARLGALLGITESLTVFIGAPIGETTGLSTVELMDGDAVVEGTVGIAGNIGDGAI